MKQDVFTLEAGRDEIVQVLTVDVEMNSACGRIRLGLLFTTVQG